MKARTALLSLFKDSHEWRSFFRSCCETGTFGLCSQSWQFRDELADRGCGFFGKAQLEDALLGLARELAPRSPAAQWDGEWAMELCKDAIARLAEHYASLSAEEKDALDLSGQEAWDERMHAAGSNNDPAAFRKALEGWGRAGLEALERARAKGGAA